MENETENQTGRANLVVTYNSVEGYDAGTYEGRNGPVVIQGFNGDFSNLPSNEAESRLGDILHSLYGRIDPNDVERIFLYVGLNAKDGALRAAQRMAGDVNDLTLVACDCFGEEKQSVAERIGSPIIWSECGGERTLGRIVTEMLE